MSNADDFKDRPVRVSRLSPSHTARTSVFLIPPNEAIGGIFSQDVSPPSVIWIPPFPFVMCVQTHYPEMFLPNRFVHLRQGTLPVLH